MYYALYAVLMMKKDKIELKTSSGQRGNCILPKEDENCILPWGRMQIEGEWSSWYKKFCWIFSGHKNKNVEEI